MRYVGGWGDRWVCVYIIDCWIMLSSGIREAFKSPSMGHAPRVRVVSLSWAVVLEIKGRGEERKGRGKKKRGIGYIDR